MGAVALVGLLVLAVRAGTVEASPGSPWADAWSPRWLAPADTDTVAVAPPAPLIGADDLPALGSAAPPDTVEAGGAADSTARAEAYFRVPLRPGVGAAVVSRRLPGIRGRLGSYWRRDVALDSADYAYRVREVVGDADVRAPADVSLAEFLMARRQEAIGETFRSLAAQRAQRQTRRNGLGFAVDIPGGEESAFRTLFGKNEVALTVNGTSNVDLGVRYSESDAQAARSLSGAGLDPDFGQDLTLNIAGTIGDKLTINVNYDTQSQFEFENQVSLVYEGYDDDILQRFEAGNVFLQTPATLIQGGQRLFGLRTDFQFGPLALTAVASQQDAQTVQQTITGGADVQAFTLAPYEYEDDTHFFLGYAFHNWWDAGHRDPSRPTNPPGLLSIQTVQVWKHEPSLRTTVREGEQTTWAVALADLGEEPAVLAGGEAYFDAAGPDPGLPDPQIDRYSDELLASIRQDGSTVSADNIVDEPLPTGAVFNNVFRLLEEGIDYTLDPNLGWISLTSSLTEDEVIAVSYQYQTLGGGLVTVGDRRAVQGAAEVGPRTILKMLRAPDPIPDDPLWDLTLRNVYRVGGRSLTPNAFDLDLTFEPPGQTASREPTGLSLGGRTLLAAFGLDRITEQGTAGSDNTFDYRQGYTVDAGAGRIIFPVRQPFADYVADLIQTGQTVTQGDAVNVAFTGLTEAEALDLYAPVLGERGTAEAQDLYDFKRTNARRRLQGLARYQIVGEFRGSTQSVFPLGFQIVEGTVRVTADGRPLEEGSDYRVNYTSGTVEITNPLYLASSQQIEVSAEQQDLFSVTSKTLLGLRADYRISENALLGATWMSLSERPPAGLGKFRVGEEAIDNTVIGVDGSYLAEPRWLTRAVDALPFIQTRAPSRFELRGEFAQLTPGSPLTSAFGDARDALSAEGLDFAEDELDGVSYIDDFEGSETPYTAPQQVSGWQLAAPPESAGPPESVLRAPGSPATDPLLKSNWRGLFTWYTLSDNLYRDYDDLGLLNPAVTPITNTELFGERDRGDNQDLPLNLLDVYFDPTQRGPHNYSGELGQVLGPRRQEAWGGFIRPIEGAFSDFGGQNNVEFVEMLFAPFAGRDGSEAIAPGARLILDLGRLNEDTLPNAFPNGEDGLRPDERLAEAQIDAFSRRQSGGQTNGIVDFFDDSGQTEDVGIDGLPTRQDLTDNVAYDFSEQTVFADFLAALPADPVVRARAERDPSGDDYRNFEDEDYFNDGALFPGGATVQERFASFYPATELNSPIARDNILGRKDGLTANPDLEDIDGDGQTNTSDAYHRYEIPLDEAGLKASPFFVNEIDVDDVGRVGGFGDQTWYLLRIPVRSPNRTVVGLADTTDFSRIEHIRLWTTGHDKPATLRFASFELVGSQWLKSEQVGRVEEPGDSTAAFGPEPSLFIETINNEENRGIYAVPQGTVLNTSRSISSGASFADREKALVFRAEGLAEGRRAGIIRSYETRPLDLTRYRNLRMAVHGHGFERADSMRVFLRIGDDDIENYYEIEQPVFPFDPQQLDALGLPECPPENPFNCARSDSLWQTQVPVGGGVEVDLNPINLVLAELNELKRERDLGATPPGERFTRRVRSEGVAPDARITVRGEPSLQDVRTVTLGVRNAAGGSPAPLADVEVWYNELRVTGYEQGGGGSGFLSAKVNLADVASLDARLSYVDDGFGDLGGALGGRAFASRQAFTLSSTFAAHKLLPERFGWSIPVSFSATENSQTPRFDPDNGDVRLSDLIATAEASTAGAESGGVETTRQLTAEQVLTRAQTTTSSRNLRVQATKSGSRSPWLKYTVEGLTASYTLSTQDGRNPSSALTSQDSWTGNVSYRVSVPKPLPVRPFWFTRSVPVLGVLGGLQLNLLPQNVSLSADVARRITADQPRLREEFLLNDPEEVQAFRTFTRRTQLFDHGRQFDVRYNPFSFLQLSYASTTDQDLGRAGQREVFRFLVRDTEGDFQRTYTLATADVRDDETVLADLGEAGLLGENGTFAPSVEVLGGSDLDVVPVGEALGNLFGGDGPGLRTRRYGQTFTSTLRLSTRRVKWLSWIQPQAVSYSTNYSWTDQPVAAAPELEVAAASTQAQIQSSLRVVPRDFWRLFPFYRKMEAAAGRGGSAARSAPTDSTGGRGALPVRLARGLFLGLTGIDDISVNYRGSLASGTGGLEGQAYSLFSAFSGAAPSLGYRLGLDREIGLDQRVVDDRVNRFLDRQGIQHDLDARTQLSPFRGLNIGFNWRLRWEEQEDRGFTPDAAAENGLVADLPGFRGSSEATVLSLGGSYRRFIDRQADRYQADVEAGETVDVDGQTVLRSEFLSPAGLAEDFRAEFARGLGGFGPNGLYLIPLPNWTVTYSGLERLPILRALTDQISVQHGYSSTSTTDVITEYLSAGEPLDTRDGFDGVLVAGAAAFADGGFDEPRTITVNQRFQPLIGVTVGWKGSIQTSVTLNKSSIYSLDPSNADLDVKDVDDIRVEFGFAKTGLSLLGLRRLNNNIRLTLTGSYANDVITEFQAGNDAQRVLAFRNGEPEVDEDGNAIGPLRDPQGSFTRRLLLSPRISYTVSNQVTADVFASYERLDQNLGSGGNTRFNGGVNLRILFSN